MPLLSIRALALAAALACCRAAAADTPVPDALLVVDVHRAAIVERTIAAWPGEMTAERAEALRSKLWSLRADRLLAASLSPGEATLAAERVTSDPRAATKAIGSPAADLVYTPLAPCRIVDTRNAVGALAANTTRTLLGFHASSFASQGGTASACGIPNGVAALAMNVYAVNPSALGFVKLWASSQAEPSVSTVNYEPPTVAIATGAIVPVNAGDNNKFNARSPAVVHLVVDVVGYFRPAFAVGAGLRVVRDPVVDTVNAVNGSSANAVTAGVRGGTIGGGGVPSGGDTDPDFGFEAPNVVTDHYGTVGGGYANRAGDNAGTVVDSAFATVAGGGFNVASAAYASITGGGANAAGGSYAFVGGGEQNQANAPHAVVAGGFGNVVPASGQYATIGGGGLNASGCYNPFTGNFDRSCGNLASGPLSTIAGGYANQATTNAATVGGGYANAATGQNATVPGGVGNMAIGHRSFAAGRQARAVGDGCFVWADNNPFDHVCGTPNSYEARATGGVIFTTAINGVGALTAGAFLNPGSGSWSAFSDERFKRDFRPVDPARILAGVVALPVGEWSYVAQAPQIRHVGPTSQAFRAAFGLGENDTTISAVDAQGVALAAIQGLNAKLEATLADRDRQIALLRDALQALAKRIERTASP